MTENGRTWEANSVRLVSILMAVAVLVVGVLFLLPSSTDLSDAPADVTAELTYPAPGLDYCVPADQARAHGVDDSVGPCQQRAAWTGER